MTEHHAFIVPDTTIVGPNGKTIRVPGLEITGPTEHAVYERYLAHGSPDGTWVKLDELRDEIEAVCAALVAEEFAKREHRIAVLRALRRFADGDGSSGPSPST